jgi:hypothetical protein
VICHEAHRTSDQIDRDQQAHRARLDVEARRHGRQRARDHGGVQRAEQRPAQDDGGDRAQPPAELQEDREIVARLADAIPDADAQLRAELLVSHLMGMALARHVTRLEPIASTPADTVAAWVGPTLQRYLTGPRPVGQ